MGELLPKKSRPKAACVLSLSGRRSAVLRRSLSVYLQEPGRYFAGMAVAPAAGPHFHSLICLP